MHTVYGLNEEPINCIILGNGDLEILMNGEPVDSGTISKHLTHQQNRWLDDAIDTFLDGHNRYEDGYEVYSFNVFTVRRPVQLIDCDRFHIKPDYYDQWGATNSTSIVDMAEIERLAEEWETTVEDLMGQVEEAPEECVVNQYGILINYAGAIDMMDDELREELHAKLAPCTDQEFFTAYEEAHENQFGEVWELAKRNPMW